MKILKNGPFVYKKKLGRHLFYDIRFENENLRDFFYNTDQYIEDAKLFFKSQLRDTTTVAMVNVKEQKFVVKRYNFRNFLHAFKLQFRKSHGFRSFFHANYLWKLDIAAIKPIAVIQKKWGFIKQQSYFISLYEEGIPGCIYFNNDSLHKNDWNRTIDLIFDTIDKMKKNSIYHGDFHFGNFVIVNRKPILLDFDRIRIVKQHKRFQQLFDKDMENFMRYLKNNSMAYALFKQHPKFSTYFYCNH